jgi:hypothetical protein
VVEKYRVGKFLDKYDFILALGWLVIIVAPFLLWPLDIVLIPIMFYLSKEAHKYQQHKKIDL